MNTSEELEDLIRDAAETNWGAELATVLDEALALAIEQGDESGEYRVRLQMANNAQMTGDTDKLLTNFAWCLAKHDEDPQRFPNEPDEGSDLMWQFKWMVGVLGGDPQFSTEQITAVLEDMEQHYTRANLGLSAVAMARFESAFHNGHQEEARTAFAEVSRTERDDYSHCDACVRSVAMDYHFSTGQNSKGLAEFRELMEGGFSCGEEPEGAISLALVPLLRAGEVAELASLHRRSYREARSNPDNVSMIANHIAFCAVTGNIARGVALAERHLEWLAHDPLSHRSHLNFLSALGLLLEKAIASGHGGVPLRGSDSASLNAFFGPRTAVLSAAELAPLCWAAANALAADFDARNGNDWHAQIVSERRAMVAENHELSLGTETFGSPTPHAIAEPHSSEEWRQLAVDLASTSQYDAALAAYSSGVRSTHEPRELASLHNTAIGIYAHMGGEQNMALLQQMVALRVAALRDAGEEVLAGLAERTAEVLAAPDDLEKSEAKLALLENELLALNEQPEARCSLQAERAHVLIEANQLELARLALADMADAITDWTDSAAKPAAEVLRRAQAAHSSLMLRVCVESNDLAGMKTWLEKNLELETSRARRASALGLRAQLATQDANTVQALADAEAATDLLVQLGAREAVAQSVHLSAAILADMGRTEEYRARLRFGIQQAQMAESPYALGLAYSLSRDLVEHGSNDEAIELLDDTLNNSGLDIGDHDKGELYELLGNALRGSGELGGALNAWLLAGESFTANDEMSRVAQLQLAASSTFQEAGYFDQAAKNADEAVETLAAAIEAGASGIAPEFLVSAHIQLAEALSLSGADGALAAIDAASELATQAESHAQAAEIKLVNARHLFRIGDVDAAVAQALQASSDLESVEGGEQQAVLALLQAAHMLDNAKRHDDAVSIYRSVLDELEGDRQGQEIVRHQLADCLEAAGRSAEAVTVRAEAEAKRPQ